MATTQWEYRTITAKYGDAQNKLNTLGLEGWELVSTNMTMNEPNICFFLKRQKA